MLKKITFLLLIILLASLTLMVQTNTVQAQSQNGWSEPRRLSSEGISIASEAYFASDQFGFLHTFWIETDNRGLQVLMYARYDGSVWSLPVDLRLGGVDTIFGIISPVVDENGILHLVWSEGNTGPVYYSSAPAYDALSAQSWSRPQRIQVPGFFTRVQIDQQGILHLIYTNFYAQEPGLYYVNSEDGGRSWSNPRWIDPDIPVNAAPRIMYSTIDDQGGLHVVWYYIEIGDNSATGFWVRYANSLDGGQTWSTPFTVDSVEPEDDEDELRLPHPSILTTGDEVHIIWAGNRLVQREHRVSYDRGQTWSETKRILGDLGGQGLGAGFAKDANGRLHYVPQIRWPQAVYHSYWDSEAAPEWSDPEIAYLISTSDEEGRQGRYHAHSVRAEIMQGNKLVIAFTDEAVGPLYVMERTLDAADQFAPAPIPSPTPTPLPPATAVPTPTPVSETILTNGEVVEDLPSTGGGVWVGILPVILFIAGVFSVRFMTKR